jgi:hypothetical protein
VLFQRGSGERLHQARLIALLFWKRPVAITLANTKGMPACEKHIGYRIDLAAADDRRL